MSLIYILFLLTLIISIFLFPFLIMWWVERDIYQKPVKQRDYQLYRQIEMILHRSRTKEKITAQLTQLLQKYGYRLSRRSEAQVVFKPVSFFSRKSTIRIDISHYPTARQRVEKLRIHAESAIGLLTKVAKADGRISRAEANFITRSINRYVIMAKQEEDDTASLQAFRSYLVAVHKEAKKDHRTTVLSYALPLKSAPRHTKIQLLRQMLKIAGIDGSTPYKEHLISEAGLAMGIEERYFRQFTENRSRQNSRQQQRRRYSSQNAQRNSIFIPEHYRILGCSPQDEITTIKKKYRALVKKYHPDFTQTTDEASKAHSLQKMQEINLAYEKVKREKQFC